MDIKEYLEKRRTLHKQLDDLAAEYIRSNTKFPNGTKVKIHYNHYGANYPTGYDEYGIIMGYEIFFDEVRPIVAKMKKDGTAHATARLYVSSNSNIEACD